MQRIRGLRLSLWALAAMAAGQPAREADGTPRLPIDRVFSMRGFGTVVTHQVPIGTFDGPHPFFAPDGKLL